MGIGVDAQFNNADALIHADWPFQLSEQSFCVFFSWEWLMRFLAFERKRNCLVDSWFKFDSALVLIMVVETWVMQLVMHFIGGGGLNLPTGPLKLLRLLRLARVARAIRALPELVTLIKGMYVASRAVGTSMLLLIVLIYVFGIVAFMQMGPEDEDDGKGPPFGTLGYCMWTLLMDGVFLDNTGEMLMDVMMGPKWYMLIIFLIFIVLSALTVMNMLIGVLCEVVTAVSSAEIEEHAITALKETVLVFLMKLDSDGNGDGLIDKQEFEAAIHDPVAVKTLEGLKVHVGYLDEVKDMLYSKADNLTIKQVMELLLQLRCEEAPTVKHVIEICSFYNWRIDQTIERLENLLVDIHSHVRDIPRRAADTDVRSPEEPVDPRGKVNL